MNSTVKILIADDEERWRRLVGDFLRNEGYKIVEASNGQEAVEMVSQDSDICLVILDIMMPVMDGIQACEAIRDFSDVPIIMLTAKNDEDSEVLGFGCGADEYIAKPVKFPVFIARVKALLKRSVSLHAMVEVAGICIDPDAHTVTVDGQEVALTPREFELLLYVAQNKNIALSRQQILSAVWNFDYFGDARTVDTHVKNLRMKLGSRGSALKTVRGRGYKLEG
jgi:DNA-binding response OmpR family regulator